MPVAGGGLLLCLLSAFIASTEFSGLNESSTPLKEYQLHCKCYEIENILSQYADL